MKIFNSIELKGVTSTFIGLLEKSNIIRADIPKAYKQLVSDDETINVYGSTIIF